ncbi:MAG: lysine--tRNA ligase [Candidatus Cloacimonetes bacterium]|nr:lysine--tRNA ligase [Candidatus Cloacimonadota bacterium]
METPANQFVRLRLEKLHKIRDLGIDPYPVGSHRTHYIADLLQDQAQWITSTAVITISGRLVALRRQGKIGFGNVEDKTARIQIFVQQNAVGEENYELFKLMDTGDFVQVSGALFVTQAGEYSVKVCQITLLSKNIRPLPAVKEKVVEGKTIRYDEFSDIELRYRKRYLDLLLNPHHRQVFELRALIISAIREFLQGREFTEVETPILQPLYGGANARPFITHHNSLDTDLYLRIALELYLKRLVVGGFERVYELGRNFRNEGMDRLHNPEFTMLELYQAFSDLDGMMELTEGLIKHLAANVIGKNELVYQGHTIHIDQPWRKATMIDLVREYTGVDAAGFDADMLGEFCRRKEIEVPEGSGAGKMIALIFERFVEDHLVQPTFVTDFPKEISPLAKAKPGVPMLADRFELIIAGGEFANAFSELNDPFDQRARFEDQARKRALGDDEALVIDEDFLEALEYGMPPMGGLGIGIDRLVMLLTENDSIKEVILFPQMKPETSTD